MSILQDLFQTSNELGNETRKSVGAFLKCHPNYLLDDVYYREFVWKQFENWCETQKNYSLIKENGIIVDGFGNIVAEGDLNELAYLLLGNFIIYKNNEKIKNPLEFLKSNYPNIVFENFEEYAFSFVDSTENNFYIQHYDIKNVAVLEKRKIYIEEIEKVFKEKKLNQYDQIQIWIENITNSNFIILKR